MAEAPGFQVSQNQPVEITVTGVPGGPGLRVHAASAQTGDLVQGYGNDLTKVYTIGTLGEVNGRVKVVSGSGATVTLTTQQSGSTCLFDRAAGIVYTLPPPQVGLWYDFVVVTTITSNNATVITDVGTTFVQGSVRIASSGTAGDFQGNGTSHVKIQMNGTTTGGVLGTRIRVVCVTATQWQIDGSIQGSGVAATPFA